MDLDEAKYTSKKKEKLWNIGWNASRKVLFTTFWGKERVNKLLLDHAILASKANK